MNSKEQDFTVLNAGKLGLFLNKFAAKRRIKNDISKHLRGQ